MRLKTAFLGIALAILTACQAPLKTEVPAFGTANLQADLNEILIRLSNPSVLNQERCAESFAYYLPAIDQERLYQVPISEINQVGPKLMQTSFEIRLAVTDRIHEFGKCRKQVRELIFRTRSLEDLIGERLYGPEKWVSSYEIKFESGPTPILDTDFFKGYLTRPGIQLGPKFDFKPGDLLLEKGNSFISAMLSNAVSPRGHLSHFALVGQHPDTRKPITIESFIQSGGVAHFEMPEALRKYNVRIVLLRPRSLAEGERMSKIVWDKVEEERKSGRQIKYDFAIDFEDDSQMSCSELVLWGYRKSSGGKTIIPAEFSELDQSMKRILSFVGIKPGKVLTPMDVEVDPNFQTILEFRDYRFIRESRYRDAIFTELMRWMKEESYLPVRNPPQIDVAKMIAPMRRSGVPTPKNEKGELEVPLSFIQAIRKANAVSDILLKRLKDRDDQFIAKNGWPMTNDRLLLEVNRIRLDDLKKFNAHELDSFHHLFRPLSFWELLKELVS